MQYSTATFAASVVVAAALVAAQSKLTAFTPSAITTCVANRLTWTGGVAPYAPYIIVPLQPQTILATLPKTSELFSVYTPDGTTSGISVGDTVAVYVVDSTGINAGSAGTQVISGGSCAGSAGSSAASGSSTAAAATSSESSTRMASAASTTRASTSAASTPSTSSPSQAGSASAGLKVSGGLIAGVVGLLAAALV
ncbi:hypothetical protein CF327_g1248 [Tilletia walkeri]|uniref:Uncharacterized protein n=1 Tax=Tilletia walkeri TaxID=117179 RepID=A0A8X7T6J4_9BASI|nr:hypothetical protein CF327_g1248 [Tilletia walkeri]KAE8269373.1 hypothetical protein A4X09_0g2977 [Tilletia walkeri]